MHTVYICTVIYVPTGSFSHALNAALHDVKVNSTDASVAKRLRCTTGRQHRQRSSWMQLHIQVLKCSDYVRFFENDSLIPWYPRWLSSSSQGSIRIEPLPIASAEAVSRNHKVLSPECNSSISQVFLTLSSGVFRSHTFLNNKGQAKRQKTKKEACHYQDVESKTNGHHKTAVRSWDKNPEKCLPSKNNSSGIACI